MMPIYTYKNIHVFVDLMCCRWKAPTALASGQRECCQAIRPSTVGALTITNIVVHIPKIHMAS